MEPISTPIQDMPKIPSLTNIQNAGQSDSGFFHNKKRNIVGTIQIYTQNTHETVGNQTFIHEDIFEPNMIQEQEKSQ